MVRLNNEEKIELKRVINNALKEARINSKVFPKSSPTGKIMVNRLNIIRSIKKKMN